ncbi:MAG: biotin transporter BioY [Alphaproteobacteria bacterium]|nr:biotin transporter BioY [Alphaproteobacteria bacterium]
MTSAHAASRPIVSQLWPASGAAAAVRAAVLALFGSLLLAVSAKVQVPFWPVPMTMQTFVVLVLGAAYGWRLGLVTVLVYLAEGAAGLPVFAGTPEKGIGLAYMAGPTGGYLVGFAVAAALVGFLAGRGWTRGWIRLTVAMLLGHAAIFACGLGWIAPQLGWSRAVAVGLAPFWMATVLKTALAVAVVAGLERATRRRAF